LKRILFSFLVRRYNHGSFVFKQNLYIFGGIGSISGSYGLSSDIGLNDLWVLDIGKLPWKFLRV